MNNKVKLFNKFKTVNRVSEHYINDTSNNKEKYRHSAW